MKIPGNRVVSISLIGCISVMLFSCSPQQRLLTYKDPQYPVVIRYTKQSSTVVTGSYGDSGKIYTIEVVVNYSQGKAEDSESYTSLYDVSVYQDLPSFKQHVHSYATRDFEGVIINDLPAIAVKDKSGSIEEYVFLLPNNYVTVWFTFGAKPSDALDRLKHFHWTQPIDTNSSEFKAWKAHIWEILKSSPAPQKSNVKTDSP